jgi:hypothetical protein
MNTVYTIATIGVSGAISGAIVLGALGLYYQLRRIERNVVYKDDSTIRGRMQFRYDWYVDHDYQREFAVILGRGAVLGSILCVVLWIFGLGLLEVVS